MEQLFKKYIERIKIDYPEDDKLMIDLHEFYKEMQNKNPSEPHLILGGIKGQLLGFNISIIENIVLADGKAVLLLSSNDYKSYKDKLNKAPVKCEHMHDVGCIKDICTCNKGAKKPTPPPSQIIKEGEEPRCYNCMDWNQGSNPANHCNKCGRMVAF